MQEVPAREQGMMAPLLLAVACGALIGLGLFTFGYAKGASYMTDRPEACMNCHVMRDNYDTWLKSSHRKVAVCNDCHTPPGAVAKYSTKAMNGFFHSLAFTTGRFPDDIQITERNYKVTDAACLKCHAEITDGLRAVRLHKDGISCLRCHLAVGHAGHAD